MQPTPARYAALAASSPWRWTRLHLRHRSEGREIEAWVHRPNNLTVVDPRRGGAVVERGFDLAESAQARGAAYAPPPATFDADGLVVGRTEIYLPGDDDLMFENYQWVAMLDPFELSHDVEIRHLRPTDRRSRETWSAYLVPQLGYNPRCADCCDLLVSLEGWRAANPEDMSGRPHPPNVDYPAGFWVDLDVQTGIVVRVRPDGGQFDHTGFEVIILGVDDDVPDLEVVRDSLAAR